MKIHQDRIIRKWWPSPKAPPRVAFPHPNCCASPPVGHTDGSVRSGADLGAQSRTRPGAQRTAIARAARVGHGSTGAGIRWCVPIGGVVPLLMLAPILTLASPLIEANALEETFMGPESGVLGLKACVPMGESEFEQISSTAIDCVADRAVSRLFDTLFDNLSIQGKSLFGQEFHIDNRVYLSMASGDIRGDLDAVIPLHSFTSTSVAGPDSTYSSFVQSGVSRWTDDHGVRRNDTRLGLVHRFTTLGGPGDDVVGVSAFLQESVEVGHQRLVASMDYAGLWGQASVSYFMPTTDWRRGRSELEERALEGLDLGLRLNPTTTIGVDGRLGRWEAKDGSGAWVTRGRLSLAWRPHPWLGFATVLDSVGTSRESMGIRAAVAIPFGGGSAKRPRWQGLGQWRALGSAVGTDSVLSSMWRSVDAIGPIEFAERLPSYTTGQVVSGAQVRFLQESAGTGSEIRLEVTLPTPVSSDTRFLVQLVPGTGENPAVPGEDYDDSPIEVVIRAGEATGSASVELLYNPDLTEDRSLGTVVTVG